MGLTAVFEGLVDHTIFAEIDDEVAAVWSTILEGGSEWLAGRILSFDLNIDNVRDLLLRTPCDTAEKAFQTIVRNRTHHGGILAPGSSLTKRGENGKGLGQRWYAKTLAQRVRAIGSQRHRFTFLHGDGIEVMKSHATDPQTAFFIDPPYTAGTTEDGSKRAGSRLYRHHEVDHKHLFAVACNSVGDVLLTYDDTPEIREIANLHTFVVKRVAMQNTHNTKLSELLIGRDLSWFRPSLTQQEFFS